MTNCCLNEVVPVRILQVWCQLFGGPPTPELIRVDQIVVSSLRLKNGRRQKMHLRTIVLFAVLGTSYPTIDVLHYLGSNWVSRHPRPLLCFTFQGEWHASFEEWFGGQCGGRGEKVGEGIGLPSPDRPRGQRVLRQAGRQQCNSCYALNGPFCSPPPSHRRWWQQQVPIGRGPSLHRQKSHLVRGAMLCKCHSKPLKMGQSLTTQRALSLGHVWL